MQSCHITLRNTQKDILVSVSKKSVQSVVNTVLSLEERTVDALSIYFVSDTRIRKLHEDFFQDSSSTDCISIPLDADFSQKISYRYLGDVFICTKTAFTYVKENTTAFWEELTLYLVHGMLHLLGYDDITPPLKATMRKKERIAMSLLAKKGLLLNGTFR